jgi:hypothetical protein
LSYGFVLHAVVFLPVVILGFLAFLYLGLNSEKVAQFRLAEEGLEGTRTAAKEQPAAIEQPSTEER